MRTPFIRRYPLALVSAWRSNCTLGASAPNFLNPRIMFSVKPGYFLQRLLLPPWRP